MPQSFGSVERPGELARLRFAEAADPGGYNGSPQRGMVMPLAAIGRHGGLPSPGLAVVLIIIPASGNRLAAVLHQHAMPNPHVPVEVLHQPLPPAAEQARGFISASQKMFAIHHPAGYGQPLRVALELFIQPPLVRRLILQSRGALFAYQLVQVRCERVRVARVIDSEIPHTMAAAFKLTGKLAHRRENSEDFLAMMEHVIGLLTDFHQDVEHLRAWLDEPTVQAVKLIAENQPQRGHAW